MRLFKQFSQGNFRITKMDKTRPHVDIASNKKNIRYHVNIIEYNGIFHVCSRVAVQLSKFFICI